MKSTNPVLARISKAAQQPRYSVPGQGAPAGYGAPAEYGAPTGYGTPAGHPEVVQTGTPDVMTMDDVVVKTVTLLGITAVTALITAFLLPTPSSETVGSIMTTWFIAMGVGLVLGLIISFKQIANPAVHITYAVVEGIFLGAVSLMFETFYPGVVVNAVVATLGVFLIMAGLYKTKIIRATPKFMKIVIGAAAGLAVVMLFNLGYYFITGSVSSLRDGGPLAIGFSLVCIVVASMMLVVSFKQIEDGIAARLPRKYGWLGAFGILVELVWLYLEFLRLLSYFMGED